MYTISIHTHLHTHTQNNTALCTYMHPHWKRPHPLRSCSGYAVAWLGEVRKYGTARNHLHLLDGNENDQPLNPLSVLHKTKKPTKSESFNRMFTTSREAISTDKFHRPGDPPLHPTVPLPAVLTQLLDQHQSRTDTCTSASTFWHDSPSQF
jgi:hypothetical protein